MIAESLADEFLMTLLSATGSMLSQPHTQLALDPVASTSSAYEDVILPGDGSNRVNHNNRHREEEEESESFVRSTTTEMEEDDDDDSPRSSLDAYNERLTLYLTRVLQNTARVRTEFESSLMAVLTLNVLYMYYVDHKLLVLFIRATQVVRLLYYPYASESTQRNIGWLVFLSNVAVVLIHAISILNNEPPGRMLFINFIGVEPKSIFKVFFLDTLIILLEALLLQCRAERSECMFLTSSPIPVTPATTRLPSQDDEGEEPAHRLPDDEDQS